MSPDTRFCSRIQDTCSKIQDTRRIHVAGNMYPATCRQCVPSFTLPYGRPPSLWKRAIIIPVPKIPHPTELSDFRPISVTPLLSRIVERIVVKKFLLPFLPTISLRDQFAYMLNYCLFGCSYLLSQLKYQNLSSQALDIIFQALILSKITYAFPSFAGHLSSSDNNNNTTCLWNKILQVSQSHQRSLKMASIWRSHTSFYSSTIVTMAVSVPFSK